MTLILERANKINSLKCFNFTMLSVDEDFLILFYLQEKLPPTDSRLRPDQRYLENGEYEMANSEKLRLEQRQRQVN